MTQAVASKKSEIQAATINKVTDKQTGEVFFIVKSDSQPNTWYHVRFDQQALRWNCECPAMKPCKHERAVQEVLVAARKARDAERKAEREAEYKRPSEKGNLNGNRGFSLLK